MEIRFKLDENLPIDAETLPRARDFDVETALSEGPAGAADAKILDACGSEGRMFVTLDLDLADIRGYPPGENSGIWVLRPPQQSARWILEPVRGAVGLLNTETPKGRLWVVENDRIRIRE